MRIHTFPIRTRLDEGATVYSTSIEPMLVSMKCRLPSLRRSHMAMLGPLAWLGIAHSGDCIVGYRAEAIGKADASLTSQQAAQQILVVVRVEQSRVPVEPLITLS